MYVAAVVGARFNVSVLLYSEVCCCWREELYDVSFVSFGNWIRVGSYLGFVVRDLIG